MKSLFLIGAVALPGETLIKLFDEFVAHHKKAYETVEETLFRMRVFHENQERLEEAKKNDPSAKHTHLSPFADWTADEWKNFNSYKSRSGTLMALPTEEDLTPLSVDSYDGREHGFVNPIKDQAQCGSCWAFSTVCNIEAANVVQGKGQLLSLSEQELVDCSNSDMGCNGGLQPRAFKDMINGKFGLVLEKDYPYHATDGKCVKDTLTPQVFINSWKAISSTESQMPAALVQYGPLAIGLNATPMQFYKGGISDPWFCNPWAIDHAINLVGYGSDGGKDYWTVRNSWGTIWGEKGYYRLRRGHGKCGVTRAVSTAIINPKQGNFFAPTINV